MAAYGEGEGEVLEIGSFHGKSTCYLAHGLKMRQEGVVYAVDHFQGSPEHQAGMTHEEPALIEEGTLYKQFMKNIESNDLTKYVHPIVANSVNASINWKKPIRLLFIDGEHSYSETRRDFKIWSRHVVDEGYIALHDVNNHFPGVTKFFHEITCKGGGYKLMLDVGSMRIVQKIK